MVVYYSKYLRTFNFIGSNRYRAFLSRILRLGDLVTTFRFFITILVEFLGKKSYSSIFLKYFKKKWRKWFFDESAFLYSFKNVKVRSFVVRKMFIFLFINLLFKFFEKVRKENGKDLFFILEEIFYREFDLKFKEKKNKLIFEKNWLDSDRIERKFNISNCSPVFKNLIRNQYKIYFKKKNYLFQNDFLRRIEKPFQNSLFIVGEACDFYPGL